LSNEPKNRQLQAIRIEAAVNICIQHPNLYPTIRDRKYIYNDAKERICAELLMVLMKQEPCIKKILSFYYKREGR